MPIYATLEFQGGIIIGGGFDFVNDCRGGGIAGRTGDCPARRDDAGFAPPSGARWAGLETAGRGDSRKMTLVR